MRIRLINSPSNLPHDHPPVPVFLIGVRSPNISSFASGRGLLFRGNRIEWEVAMVLPVEVHVFAYENRHFAFDARNYTVLKLDAAGAAVLCRVHELTLEEIIDALDGSVSAPIVRAHYARFLEMVLNGTLSSEPVPRPARPPFNHLVIMLAGGCNMGCTYCFERDVPIYKNPNLLTREKADDILDWFFRHQEGQTAHLQLYGGEPLLNWSVLQHVISRAEPWARDKGIELTKYLITNGTLLNPERISWLKAHGVTIQVSVDGDPQTHNTFRVFKSGKPTLDVIKPNIDELARQGADFNLRAVLTRKNTDPKKVIQGLRDLGGTRVSFEVVATEAREAQFDDRDWDAFLEQHETYVNAPFSSWTEIPDEMKSVIMKLCQRQRVFYGCGAGVSEVTVAPDGNIYECQRIYRQPYSNIAEDRSPTTLGSTLLTMVDDRPVCQDCWARYLCGGGCMHQSHVGHGSDDPLPQYCVMKRGLVEASIIKIDELRSKQKLENVEASA